jgi:CRISPR/Cas system-associated exonuclease Cas4 (RecB family)
MSQDKLICEHISVSRQQTWMDCQAKYRFRYHLKVPVEEPTQPYFIYGKLIHKVAEVYVIEQGKKDIFEIAKDCLSGKIEVEPGKDPPDLDKEYKNKLPLHLQNIKSLTDKIGYDGKTEHFFHFDLNPPNHHFLTGVIDRLIIRGDNFYILDYKTTKKGRWRKNPNTIRKDLQLRCYARVVQLEFGAKAENIKAALYYVDGGNGELVATRFSEESLVSAAQELHDTYLQITNTNPNDVYGRVGDQCKRCDYRKICSFYSLT